MFQDIEIEKIIQIIQNDCCNWFSLITIAIWLGGINKKLLYQNNSSNNNNNNKNNQKITKS